MKKIIILILIATSSHSLWSKIGIEGCYHFDHFGKKHFVACLCDCTTTHPTCIWCGHYHEAKNRLEIVKQTLKTVKKNIDFYIPTVQQALTNLVIRYKNSKNS